MIAIIVIRVQVVAYIIAEGLVDAARESTTLYVDEPEEKPPEE